MQEDAHTVDTNVTPFYRRFLSTSVVIFRGPGLEFACRDSGQLSFISKVPFYKGISSGSAQCLAHQFLTYCLHLIFKRMSEQIHG